MNQSSSLPKFPIIWSDKNKLAQNWSGPTPIHQGKRGHETNGIHNIFQHVKMGRLPFWFSWFILNDFLGQLIRWHFSPVKGVTLNYLIHDGYPLNREMCRVILPKQTTKIMDTYNIWVSKDVAAYVPWPSAVNLYGCPHQFLIISWPLLAYWVHYFLSNSRRNVAL